jgi:hypothetical protein
MIFYFLSLDFNVHGGFPLRCVVITLLVSVGLNFTFSHGFISLGANGLGLHPPPSWDEKAFSWSQGDIVDNHFF